MAQDRRRTARLPCRIPAALPGARALIADVSPHGVQLRSESGLRVGQRLPVDVRPKNGHRLRLQGVVRSVRSTPRGVEAGCSFEADAASCLVAWKLSQLVAAEKAEFQPPTVYHPAMQPRGGRGRAGRKFFTLRVLILFAGVMGLMLLASAFVVLRAMF